MSGIDTVSFFKMMSHLTLRDQVQLAQELLRQGWGVPRVPRVTNWFSEAARQVEAAKKQNRRARRAQGATAGAGVYQGSARHPARGGRAPRR